jgi:hypothetical protein
MMFPRTEANIGLTEYFQYLEYIDLKIRNKKYKMNLYCISSRVRVQKMQHF